MQAITVEEMGAFNIEWMDKKGYAADIAALRRDYPEAAWRSLEDGARAQGWKKLLG